MSTVQVVALADGHDGMHYRHAGERFYVNSTRLSDGSTWFAQVGTQAANAVDKHPTINGL